MEWQDIADFRSEYVGQLEHRDTCRKGSKLLYEFMDAGWVNEPKEDNLTVDFGSPTEKIALQKERVKVQTEKLELNRFIREYSRDEQITQYIVNAICKLEPLTIPKEIYTTSNPRAHALCFGDTHLGADFCIKGLFGQVINEYSPEIFEERMWKLLEDTKSIIKKENIDVLNVYDFADSIDGMLRVGQLFKLRYGVVDQTINYANYISNWLNELSKEVVVRYQMIVDANHSQLRQLGQPKNTFKDDNMSKVILEFIKARLENNPNISIIENPTGMIFDNLCGYNIVGIHGEVKNMGNAIRELSSIHGVEINYLIAAHLHHGKYEEVGMDTEVINIPSVVGVDDYSLSLRKTSNPGAKLFVFEEGKGKNIEYYIKLN